MIQSILDNDLYKFTMQNAVMHHFPYADVTYKFTNRDLSMKFDGNAYVAILKNLEKMDDLKITNEELNFLKIRCPYLSNKYFRYLKDFKFNPANVQTRLNNGNLDLTISGKWIDTILWEVPMLAIISECYFKHIDNAWWTSPWSYDRVSAIAYNKARKLSKMIGKWSDFGTRRRRSYDTQEEVVRTFVDSGVKNFFGTSNVHLAKKFNIAAVGTMAHEWIMGVWGERKGDPKFANVIALHKWNETYGDNLGIALTDTFGTDCFFDGFNVILSKAFGGIRHDSGDPLVFVDKAVKHYKELKIDPMTKLVVFSDSLDTEKALLIDRYCKNKINCSFGIGTHFTNDFTNYKSKVKSKPLNIVIKLDSINGNPVAKLSDDFSKATGDNDTIKNLLSWVKR